MSLLPHNKSIWQFLGQPIGWLYGIGAWVHRATYVHGPLKRVRFEPFVICIGNLSVGGTGKSPHVLYLQKLLGAVEQTAMVSRGYGRQTKGVQLVTIDSVPATVGDEPLQFKQAYPKATVVVAERRVLGIQTALEQQPVLQQILLDDALQHWEIEADCTFLLTTFEEPFFQQTLLPFGRLREFKRGYQRADVIIVSKCPPQIDSSIQTAYLAAINPLPHQQVLFSWLDYQPLYELITKEPGPSLEQPLDILLLTGIADTQALEKYLERHQVTYQRFPDHHLFTLEEVQKIQQIAAGKVLITTQKDATRLQPILEQYPSIPLAIYVLPIQVALSATDEAWLVQYLAEKKKEGQKTKKNSY